MRTKKFNTKYSPEFKISCIIDMRTNHLSYNETARKYLCEKGKESCYVRRIKLWERIFLEEGEAGFFVERRGRTRKMDNPNKGRPRKKSLDNNVKEDLIAENQYLKEKIEQLEMENEYLKKLDALVRKRLQNQKKK